MVIVDTGFWLAMANGSDRHHGRARKILANLEHPLITTWPVLTETCHLLSSRHGAAIQQKYLDIFKTGACQIFNLETLHVPRITELMKKYEDLPMDLADASLVLLAEVLGSGLIVSTDIRDFRTYRWKNRKPFENLMEPL